MIRYERKLVLAIAAAAVVCVPHISAAAETPARSERLTIGLAISGKPVDWLKAHLSLMPPLPIGSLTFSPDGKTLAAARGNEVLIWNVLSGKLERRITSGLSAIGAVLFLPDGRLAVGEGTPYGAGAVRLVDPASGNVVRQFDEPKDVVYALAVSPDGKLLAAGGADCLIRVWSLAEEKPPISLNLHTDWVFGLAFSRDNSKLVSCSADRNIRVWDCAQWESIVKFRDNDAAVAACFLNDNNQLYAAIAGPSQRSLQVRRLDNQRAKTPLGIAGAAPLCLAATSKNRVYVGCSDGNLRIFENITRLSATLPAHQDWVYSLALSSDEKRLATGGGDGVVKLWNTATGKLMAVLAQPRPGADQWVCITAEGPFAVSDAGLVEWTVTEGAPPQELLESLAQPDKLVEALARPDQPPPAPPKK